MYSHSDRHGSGDGVITEEKAKAAVFSAVFLVHFFFFWFSNTRRESLTYYLVESVPSNCGNIHVSITM